MTHLLHIALPRDMTIADYNSRWASHAEQCALLRAKTQKQFRETYTRLCDDKNLKKSDRISSKCARQKRRAHAWQLCTDDAPPEYMSFKRFRTSAKGGQKRKLEDAKDEESLKHEYDAENPDSLSGNCAFDRVATLIATQGLLANLVSVMNAHTANACPGNLKINAFSGKMCVSQLELRCTCHRCRYHSNRLRFHMSDNIRVDNVITPISVLKICVLLLTL